MANNYVSGCQSQFVLQDLQTNIQVMKSCVYKAYAVFVL